MLNSGKTKLPTFTVSSKYNVRISLVKLSSNDSRMGPVVSNIYVATWRKLSTILFSFISVAVFSVMDKYVLEVF